MVENPRRGRQAKKNCKKCSENSRSQIVFRKGIFRKLTLGAPVFFFFFFFFCRHSNSYSVEREHTAVARGLQDFNCLCSVSYSRRVLGIPEWDRISNASCKYIVLFIVHSKHFCFHFWLGLISRPMINYCIAQIWKMFTQRCSLLIWPSPRYRYFTSTTTFIFVFRSILALLERLNNKRPSLLKKASPQRILVVG